jgi:pimeloyl-ACP methyl ester carboxylesterase
VPVAALAEQQLYYEIHGEGQPLLCVMGLGSDLSGWQLQLPAWSKRYRVILFDNRDAGRSSYADEQYQVRDMARDATQLAQFLELERFHLVGMSLGGAIAQEVALAIPERVLSLTLIVSYGGGGRWARERARMEAESSAAKSDEQLLDELLLLTFSEATFEHTSQISYMRSLILSYEHRQRREGFVRQLIAGADHEARDRIRALKLPTHVIGAEQDVLVPIWKSRELAALIDGAHLSVIEGAAHAVNVERGAELAELVLKFLDSDPPTISGDFVGAER